MCSSVAENRTRLCWGWFHLLGRAKAQKGVLAHVFKIWSATDTPDLALFKCSSPELMASREEMNMLEVSAL